MLNFFSLDFDQVDRSFVFGCFSVDHLFDLFGDVFPRAKNRHIDQVDRTLGGGPNKGPVGGQAHYGFRVNPAVDSAEGTNLDAKNRK